MRRLVLGNLNYSSWSIRPLIAARKVGLPVEEVIVPLDFPETTARLKEISPTAKVPLLIWDDQTIWESLAITEWIAEWAPPGEVWPEDPVARAVARAAASEMHAGFPELRSKCPMDIRGRALPPEMTEKLAADVDRIQELWSGLRAEFGETAHSCSENGARPTPSTFRSSPASGPMACRLAAQRRTIPQPSCQTRTS
jgi:glutathione S-transferase